MRPDLTLIRSAQLNCGGGRVHMVGQWVAAYQIAFERLNHRNTKEAQRPGILAEITALESKLYELGRRVA